jgi:hypothetical protein
MVFVLISIVYCPRCFSIKAVSCPLKLKHRICFETKIIENKVIECGTKCIYLESAQSLVLNDSLQWKLTFRDFQRRAENDYIPIPFNKEHFVNYKESVSTETQKNTE